VKVEYENPGTLRNGRASRIKGYGIQWTFEETWPHTRVLRGGGWGSFMKKSDASKSIGSQD
jgi:hypothetical protein